MNSTELSQLFAREVLIFDGAMGTELYRRHIFTNRCFEELCLSSPQLIKDVHRDYLNAGADVLTTNSFGANCPALRKFGFGDKVGEINRRAAQLAREVVNEAGLNRKVLVAGTIGPLGRPKRSFGTVLKITPTQRAEMLAEQAQALLDGGADFLFFETLPNSETTTGARRAMARLPEGTPFVLSFAFDNNCNLALAIPHRLTAAINGSLPTPSAIGLNCGLGPERMLEALEEMRKATDLPIIVQPNAGLPHKIDNRSLYLCSPEYLTTYAIRYLNLGARGIGGCCGTTPEHITDLARSVKRLSKAVSGSNVVTAPAAATAAKDSGPEFLPAVPLEERSPLGAKLVNKQWITTIELSPPRGWDLTKALDSARRCKEAGIDVLNIPDGPRAAPRISAMAAAFRIQQETGQPVVLHVCARDRNYIGLQGDLLGCAALGVNNLMFVTGDPPKLGNYTFATGVFDTDSVGLVKLQDRLNHGVDLADQRIKPPTRAVIGVGADPNAIDFDKEINHLRDKVAAGANYVATQPVFDPQAFLKFADAIADLNLPIIAGIWPLASLRNALFMKNEVPGVVVPDSIITRMEKATTQEEQLATGITIAKEMMDAIRSRCAGVQVSAPLGILDAALKTIAD